jgi:CelD/BcsL family acetyltransferase involved in cellulose biosynthesis
MLGYQYRGTYYGIEIGYDTDWRKWSVGSVLKMEVLKDLFSRDDSPKLFDCSTGWSEHKARFSNCEEEEVNVLLLPRTFKNRVLYYGYVALEYCSSVLIECLVRLGVKQRVKKAIRLFSVKRTASEKTQ